MKKRIASVILAFLTVLAAIPFVGITAAAAEPVYYSATGKIPGYTGSVSSTLSAAISVARGRSADTIYVYGDLAINNNLSLSSLKKLTIKGYDSNASVSFCASNTVQINSTGGCDLTFDDIIIARANAENDENWIYTNKVNLTFGKNCNFRSGVRTTNGATIDLYIAAAFYASSVGNVTYTFDSPNVIVSQLAPVGGYGSGSTASGNMSYIINDGIFNGIFGIARNGSSSSAALAGHNGNAYFEFNGGSIKSLCTGSTNGGKTTGDREFVINGGTFDKVVIGDAASHTKLASSNADTYITVNTKSIKKKGFKIPTFSDGKKIDGGKTVIIYNNAENLADGETAHDLANVDYIISMYGGSTTATVSGSELYLIPELDDGGEAANVLINGQKGDISDGVITLTEPGVYSIYTFEEANTWYVSESDGNDANEGWYAQSPLKTLDAALGKLNGGDGTIVLLDTLSSWPNKTIAGNVTVTGKDPLSGTVYENAGITRAGCIGGLKGNLTLSFLTDNITATSAGEWQYIGISGGSYVFGEGYRSFAKYNGKTYGPRVFFDVNSNNVSITFNSPCHNGSALINAGPSTVYSPHLSFLKNASGTFSIGADNPTGTTTTVEGPFYIRLENTTSVQLNGKNNVVFNGGVQIIAINSGSALNMSSATSCTNNVGEYVARIKVPDSFDTASITDGGAVDKIRIDIPAGMTARVTSAGGKVRAYSGDSVITLEKGENSITFTDYFNVVGAQVRVPGVNDNGNDVEEGLRFIASIDGGLMNMIASQYDDATLADPDFDLADPNGDKGVGYGFVVIPGNVLKAGTLTKSTPGAKIVPASNTFKDVYDSYGNYLERRYTVCITRISPKRYIGDFVVRPYIQFANGTIRYGDAYSASVMDIAEAAISANDDSAAWLTENIADYVNEPLENIITANGANTTAQYIRNLYEAGADMEPTLVKDATRLISHKMREHIINTKDNYDLSGKTVYYVSSIRGSDSNNGTSKSTPFASISKVNSAINGKTNVAVLLERGGVYRAPSGLTVVNNMLIGAYGDQNSPKPVLMQSRQNYADKSLWEPVAGCPDLYKLTIPLKNVGIMAFDHDIFDTSDATYDEKYGLICNPGTQGIKDYKDLNQDLQFISQFSPSGSSYNISSACPLYLYSTEGNPGERFKSIEIGEQVTLLGAGNIKNLHVENISFKFTGAHAIGGGGCTNRTVKNCIFSWLGGSVLNYNANGAATNYGNAIEVYGGVTGYYVYDNWLYQIYDTAITHQYTSGTSAIMQNIEYSGNLCEYCYWSIEFYNGANSGKVENVRIHDNICRIGGYGWGSVTRFRSGMMYCGSSFNVPNSDEKTYNNIFDRCSGYLLNLPKNANEVQESNIYIQNNGKVLGGLRGNYALCSYTSAEININNLWGDKTALVCVLDPDDLDLGRH